MNAELEVFPYTVEELRAMPCEKAAHLGLWVLMAWYVVNVEQKPDDPPKTP